MRERLCEEHEVLLYPSARGGWIAVSDGGLEHHGATRNEATDKCLDALDAPHEAEPAGSESKVIDDLIYRVALAEFEHDRVFDVLMSGSHRATLASAFAAHVAAKVGEERARIRAMVLSRIDDAKRHDTSGYGELDRLQKALTTPEARDASL